MEEKIRKVSNSAVKIGDQLETMERQKSRSTEAKTLLTLFDEFRLAGENQFEKMCETWPFADIRTVIMAKRLAQLAREVDTTEQGKVCLSLLLFIALIR